MKSGTIRIIAGKWRGRRLKVPDMEYLRPTPDRVRETLFNWLSTHIPGANCLDLFAGSGVLGFEALSRGAAYVEFVDQSAEIIKLLTDELAVFGGANAMFVQANIPKNLSTPRKRFDIVFIDPPYSLNLLPTCCHYLEEQHFLNDNAYIYLEANRVIEDNELPSTWQLVKKERAGQVYYHLARRE